MPHQTNLASWLRDAGLAVVEVDGWETRGSSSFNPGGVVCHHTADGSGEIPSLRVLIQGRSDLPGPLCQVGLARSGTCYVVAAGRANHAGPGGWQGLVGNSSVWGIEAENKGGTGDPWPAKQLNAYYLLAGILQRHSAHVDDWSYICGHKEWAPSRKVDPHTIVMSVFRGNVKATMEGEELPVDQATFNKLMDAYFGDYSTKGGLIAKAVLRQLTNPATGEKKVFELDSIVAKCFAEQGVNVAEVMFRDD